jgi:hypothetical protein
VDTLDVAVEEYKTLRQEALEAIARSQAIAQYGLATAGVGVTVALLAARDGTTLSAVVLCGLIPLAGCFGATMMAAEAQRAVRAGWYLRCLEQRINQLTPGGPPTLGWEARLQDPRHRVRGYREATAAVVATAILLSGGLGGYLLASRDHWVGLAVALGADVVLFAAVGSWVRSIWGRLAWYQQSDDPQASPPA